MLSILKRWRDEGYGNIYGTDVIQEWCVRYRPSHPGPLRVLDIGCGAGRDLVAIREVLKPVAPDVELYGIECTAALAAQARKHGVVTYGLDLETSALPFPDGFMDIVIVNQVLEHLKNWLWALHEQLRVIRKGGASIVGVPNLAALHNRVLIAMGRQPSCIKADGPHVRSFTLHELQRLVHATRGLSLLECGGTYLYGLPPGLGRSLGRRLPALSATILLAIRKTEETADVLSLLGEEARFETNYFVGPAAEIRPTA
jgi:SAM-dependent methyltransferase